MPRTYVRKTDTETRPPGELVDAAPAMQHVRMLSAKGMLAKDIAARAGVTDRVIYDMIRGKRPNGHNVKCCSPDHSAAILAIEFAPSWTGEGFSPEKFKAVRESRNLSRKALGKLTGLNECTFQYWETGRSKPVRRANMEAALRALGAEWEDVSGPVEPVEESELDSFSMEFVDEFIPDYPCQVCGNTFRSRRLLAEHPHRKAERR